MVPLKRRRVASSAAGGTDGGTDGGGPGGPGGGAGESRFPALVLFLLERKMGSSRRAFLSALGRSKGFTVVEEFSESVTHIISENNSAEEVRAWLRSRGHGRGPANLLHVSWYTESMGAGRPADVRHTHRLQEPQTLEEEEETVEMPSYACQRRTGLNNLNAAITDALSLLAENAELNGEEGRGVAFRRAAAVLKALPVAVRSERQLRGLPCLGGHSLRVIRDVLEGGASSEVEETKRAERFRALKALTGIFGVGAKTAERWFREGIHTLQQLRASGHVLNRAQQAGVEHYEDLQQPVSRGEAGAVEEVVREAVLAVLPGSDVTLTGGFRRGKLTGHDVDFLLTHPEEGREEGLLGRVVGWLESRGLLLYQKTTRNSYLEAEDGPGRPSSNMDRFERCYSIFKLHRRGGGEGEGEGGDEGAGAEQGHRRWRAVRVDLVVSPISQFAFAQLGWTGSKLFERELRRWAGHEKAMSLSSHALFDNTQKRYLKAATEEEIFAQLDLEFVPPTFRNA